MYGTHEIVIYHYFHNSEFIWGYFSWNTVKLVYLPPGLAQIAPKWGKVTPKCYQMTTVVRRYRIYSLNMLISSTIWIYCLFKLKNDLGNLGVVLEIGIITPRRYTIFKILELRTIEDKILGILPKKVSEKIKPIKSYHSFTF